MWLDCKHVGGDGGPSHVPLLTWVTYTMSAMRAKPSSFSCEMKAWRSTLIWGRRSERVSVPAGSLLCQHWSQKVLTHDRTGVASGAE